MVLSNVRVQSAPAHRALHRRPDDAVGADDPRLPAARNSLNALRLFCAVVVGGSHVPKVRHAAPYAVGDLEIGGWGVAGFFAISGWLVTQSRLRLTLLPYLWRRALRIFPGYWVCLAMTAFVAAPIAALAGPGSWRPVAAVKYVVYNVALVVKQQTIASTLQGRADPHTWNLSLWTLSYEFFCYLVVGVGLCWALARRAPWPTVAAFGVVAGLHAVLIYGGFARGTVLELSTRLLAFFLAGAVLLRCRRIPLTGGVAAACAVLVAAAAEFHQVRALAALPIAYLCLWLGRTLPLQNLGRRTDISYGMYVYAFPVQQLLSLTRVASWPALPLALASIACTIPLAYLSWRFVERPALRLKSIGPLARRQPVIRRTAEPASSRSANGMSSIT